MSNSIPSLTFRIEPGYTFNQDLITPEFDVNNILLGGLQQGTGVEGIFIGKVAEYQRSKTAWLDYEGAHAIYVMGKRRSGKTYTLGVILEGLASNSWLRKGGNKQAVIMLDTMNVFITMPNNVEDTYSSENKSVIELKKWNLEKENLNIVLFYPKGASPPPEGISKEISIKTADLNGEDWANLFEVDTYSDPMGQLFSDLIEKVVLDGYKNLNGGIVTAKKDYTIDDLIFCIENCQAIIDGYHPDTIRGVKTRLKALKRYSIFSNEGVNLKDIFVPGQISVLLMRDLDQNIRSLLVGTLVKKIIEFRSVSDKYERLALIHKERSYSLEKQGLKDEAEKENNKFREYSLKSEEGLPRGWIIIDEAHNYMPSRGITPSGEPLKKYVNEGRNLGLSIVVATQNPSALDPSIRRNADILIIHSISMRDDISVAEGMVNTFIPDAFEFGKERISSRVFEQLIRSLPLGYAVISNDRSNRIFVLKIRPRITIHGGVEY